MERSRQKVRQTVAHMPRDVNLVPESPVSNQQAVATRSEVVHSVQMTT